MIEAQPLGHDTCNVNGRGKDSSKMHTGIDDCSQKLPRRGRDEVKKSSNALVRPTISPTTLSVEQPYRTEPIDRFGDQVIIPIDAGGFPKEHMWLS